MRKEEPKEPRAVRGLSKRNKRLQAYLIANEQSYQPRLFSDSIDLDQIKRMASVGCTMEEMAGILRCSVDYLTSQSEKNPAFAIAIDEGRTGLKQSLRHAQVQQALNGSTAMLIWLGKQLLQQSDKQETMSTTVNITVQRAMDELRNIPKDQLVEAQRLLSGRGVGAQVIENSDEKPDTEGGGPPV